MYPSYIYTYLEPQTTIYKWMFGETTIFKIFYIKIWNHPIETTKLRTSVVNLKTARRSSSSGDQSILGSTVSAGPWWGCEVWWKNYEDGTTNGVFPWMVGGKVTLANHVTSWWFQTYFIFIPDPGEGFHFDKHFWDGLKPPTSKSWNFWHLYFCFRHLWDVFVRAL